MSHRTPSAPTVESHVSLLETQNRLLKRICGLLTVIVAAFALFVITGWKQSVQDAVRARSFILVNASGKEIAILGPDTIGGARLEMQGADGYIASVLGTGPDQGGMLSMFDRAHVRTVNIESQQGGGMVTVMSGGLRMVDQPSWVCQIGARSESRSAGLLFASAISSPARLALSLDRNGQPQVSLYNATNKSSSHWLMDGDSGSLRFFDQIKRSEEVSEPSSVAINSPTGSITRKVGAGESVWPPKAK